MSQREDVEGSPVVYWLGLSLLQPRFVPGLETEIPHQAIACYSQEEEGEELEEGKGEKEERQARGEGGGCGGGGEEGEEM